MTNDLVGALLFAVFAFVLLRSFRVQRFRSRPRNRPQREQESLAAIVREVYPDVPLRGKGSKQSQRSRDPQQRFPWMIWLERQKLQGLSLVRETSDPDWTGAEVLTRLHHIEADVIESVAGLMQRRIRALTDVERPFQWSIRPEADVSELTKYDREYAERIVRTFLVEKGHTVVFPEPHSRHREQFFVDGVPFTLPNPFQFDHGLHLGKLPGIDLVSTGDFFQTEDSLFALDSSPRAHRLTMLTGTGLDRAITADRAFADAGAGTQAPAVTGASLGGVDYHSPVITLGLSSLREIRLLRKKHTDLKTAARNIGLDVAGTGVGGFAGAKAGATFGTAIAPGVGSVVGALLGGIGGAIAGRKVTNKIKLAEADLARVRYEEAVTQFHQRLAEVTGAARASLEKTIRNEQVKLSGAGSVRLKEYASFISRLETAIDEAFAFPPHVLNDLLARCERNIARRENEIMAQRRVFGFWQRTLWPVEEPIRLSLAAAALRQQRDDLSAARSALSDAACPLNSTEKTVIGLQLVASCAGQGEEIRRHLTRYKSATERALNKIAAYPSRPFNVLVRKRLLALNTIRTRTHALRQKTHAQLSRDVRKVRRAQNRFAKELRKLGLGA